MFSCNRFAVVLTFPNARSWEIPVQSVHSTTGGLDLVFCYEESVKDDISLMECFREKKAASVLFYVWERIDTKRIRMFSVTYGEASILPLSLDRGAPAAARASYTIKLEKVALLEIEDVLDSDLPAALRGRYG